MKDWNEQVHRDQRLLGVFGGAFVGAVFMAVAAWAFDVPWPYRGILVVVNAVVQAVVGGYLGPEYVWAKVRGAVRSFLFLSPRQ